MREKAITSRDVPYTIGLTRKRKGDVPTLRRKNDRDGRLTIYKGEERGVSRITCRSLSCVQRPKI